MGFLCVEFMPSKTSLYATFLTFVAKIRAPVLLPVLRLLFGKGERMLPVKHLLQKILTPVAVKFYEELSWR